MSQETVQIGEKELEALRNDARLHPLKRARINLHRSPEDKIQEMVIAVCKRSYIGPHRQRNKEKSYVLIEGEMMVAFFDDSGKCTRKIRMMKRERGTDPVVYRFPSGEWHTVVSLSELVVYIEIAPGPYRPEETEFANWGPNPKNALQQETFLASLERGI